MVLFLQLRKILLEHPKPSEVPAAKKEEEATASSSDGLTFNGPSLSPLLQPYAPSCFRGELSLTF